jgi:hypothetical protein
MDFDNRAEALEFGLRDFGVKKDHAVRGACAYGREGYLPSLYRQSRGRSALVPAG